MSTYKSTCRVQRQMSCPTPLDLDGWKHYPPGLCVSLIRDISCRAGQFDFSRGSWSALALRERNVITSDEPHNSDRAGCDCGDKVGALGAKVTTNRPTVNGTKMITGQDKAMMTDQSHASHAAPATMPVVLHLVSSAVSDTGQSSAGLWSGQAYDSTRRAGSGERPWSWRKVLCTGRRK